MKLLRAAAPSAFRSGVDAKVGYSTFAVDLMSIMFSLFHKCRDGHELKLRLREMLRQHKYCSRKSAGQKLVSVFAIEDYARTPKNKEIERKSRIEESNSAPYNNSVEVWLKTSFIDESGHCVDSASMPAANFALLTLDSRLPKDFSRVRATPALMRQVIRFLCKIIAENVEFLTDNDPNHLIIVDGFRDYKNLDVGENENVAGSEAAAKVDTWRSDTGEMFNGSNIGEGEVKATSWAVNYNSVGHVLVHANDGDLLPLLSIFSARVPHENTITGVMSQSYLFPVDNSDVAQTSIASTSDEKDNRKVFDSMQLAVGIYETINQNQQEKGLVMPQTYFTFMLMCGNDYVDSLYGVGPAKLMTAIASRKPGFLDKAVLFSPDDNRVNVEVDEKVLIQTLFACAAKVLEKNNETVEKIAAWIRRVVWTLDYNINAPLGNGFLDPCAERDGKSLHGYSLDENGRCVIQNDVWRPTIVRFTQASDRLKRDASCAFEPPPDTVKIIEEAHTSVKQEQKSQSVKKLKTEEAARPPAKAQIQNLHELMKTLTPQGNSRAASLLTIRQPVPFGVSKEEY